MTWLYVYLAGIFPYAVFIYVRKERRDPSPDGNMRGLSALVCLGLGLLWPLLTVVGVSVLALQKVGRLFGANKEQA